MGRLTRVSPFLYDAAPAPPYHPSRAGSATSQGMPSLSGAYSSQSPPTAPLKWCRVPIPSSCRVLQPLDDLLGIAGMLSGKRPTNEDALDGFGHVQPTAPKRCVERHDPPCEHPQ